MVLGLYVGSFDPPHLGHLSVIESASLACDRLVVAAVGNPNKTDGLLGLPERRNLLAASSEHLGNVVAVSHQGLTVDLATALGADFLVRGIGKEWDQEFEMAATNQNLSGIPTLFFPPDASSAWISSRMVRHEHRLRGVDGLAGLVPGAVQEGLRRGVAAPQA